jgi:SAM-dependent methyltransferase
VSGEALASRAVERYQDLNRASWDDRAAAHAASPDYRVDELIADPARLSHVVAFDAPRLGDLHGVRGVHLQCHIGTDTLSLTRLGAQMTGVDLSPASLEQARRIAARAGAEIEYVEAEVYDAPRVLDGASFDLVYTGVGALCWLPSVSRWAQTVAALLTPGGRLFIREGHPMMWTLDEDRRDGVLAVRYPYFETEEPMVFDDGGTYVQTDVAFEHNRTHVWNHGLGEIVTALQDAGLALTMLAEHDTAPWNALPGQMEQVGGDEWRLIDRPERVAMSYTLQAVRAG